MAGLTTWIVLTFSAGMLLPLGLRAPRPASGGNLLLVVNKGDQTLSVVDPRAAKELGTVKLSGFTGHEVAASPDGRLAYVPIYGNSGVGAPGTNGDTIDVIDLAARKRIAEIKLPHPVRPHCAIFAPDGMLYVTAELSDAIDVIDPHTRRVVGSIPTRQKESHMLAITSDGKRGYTANVGAGSVTALDLVDRRALAVIPVAKTVQRISISPDNSMAFTSDQSQPRVAVIDTATNRVKSWIALPGIGFGTRSTLDGRWLLVTVPHQNLIAVVDLQSLHVEHTIPVPPEPQEILMRPDGKVAYVSCDKRRQIAVLDLDRWKVAGLIAVGRNDDGLAWAAHE